VAKRLGAPVHVVRAVEPVHGLPISTGTLGQAPVLSEEITDRIWQEAEATARETVKSAILELQRDGVDADGATLSGSPFFAISDATEPDDLIILTSHGRGGVRRWLLGSVAEKLVREAPAPVLLVPSMGRDSASN
jgi:nucleotide-binding universal stress UspA family protein